ncbi:hypothetical protein, conserved [Eimeria tenella]|uniref:Uncharacterized protein n=1 Tax=Eimeria tenella TaxID=5802 RepID=U6KGQ2_EIMTE|nr:hypothetical protein, conserved [Eimeria tenella]CDJ37215.1 hypothetical protein, conserved [Eimeria tenella]|eukprot:XP_013228053.1 hypothetical protein, conserved [Eimeria tenella]
MESKESSSFYLLLQQFWSCCIAPPAAWGAGDGYYPYCFSILFLSLSAFLWYLFAALKELEKPILLLIPQQQAAAVRSQLRGCRALVAAHKPAAAAAAAAEDVAAAAATIAEEERLEVNCPVCSAAIKAAAAAAATAAEPAAPSSRATASTRKPAAAAAAAAAAECPVLKSAARTLSASRNRCVGFYHSLLVSLLSLFCIFFDKKVYSNKIQGTSLLSTTIG